MSNAYYRFFPGDYLHDTSDLSLLEHGAYMLLLHHYYRSESLPSEKKRLYTIASALTDEEKAAVDCVIQRYFLDSGNGHLINNRVEKELVIRRKFYADQREKSKKGVEARTRGLSRG